MRKKLEKVRPESNAILIANLAEEKERIILYYSVTDAFNCQKGEGKIKILHGSISIVPETKKNFLFSHVHSQANRQTGNKRGLHSSTR